MRRMALMVVVLAATGCVPSPSSPAAEARAQATVACSVFAEVFVRTNQGTIDNAEGIRKMTDAGNMATRAGELDARYRSVGQSLSGLAQAMSAHDDAALRLYLPMTHEDCQPIMDEAYPPK